MEAICHGRFREERWATRLGIKLTERFSFVRCQVDYCPPFRNCPEQTLGFYTLRAFVKTKAEERQVNSFISGWVAAHDFACDIRASTWDNEIKR